VTLPLPRSVEWFELHREYREETVQIKCSDGSSFELEWEELEPFLSQVAVSAPDVDWWLDYLWNFHSVRFDLKHRQWIRAEEGMPVEEMLEQAADKRLTGGRL